MIELFRSTNIACSKLITKRYSTSFSLGIRAFSKELRNPIYAIYGFVRYADEIVDTFHEYEKDMLLREFTEDTWKAIDRKISLNPVLDSFQQVVNQYNIGRDLIEAFLHSMEMDLNEIKYQETSYQEYIYGSAEVVGLMCLSVFTDNNPNLYAELRSSARSLGAAFQKVNFLRDIKDDYLTRGRTYFPEINLGLALDEEAKMAIELDIEKDFNEAYVGIIKLPESARAGVFTAYWFYLNLFKKIRKVKPQYILEQRVRVSNPYKIALMAQAIFKTRLNLI